MVNGLLERSLRENIVLEMIYLSNQNQITQRRIIVRENKDSSFRAFCYLRKQTRIFKKENILSISQSKYQTNWRIS
ncbi:hypothetical protein ACFYKX_07505 [Cytobacillus sp. FJAT-54145]|uniref:WYL domain-containing protein n=1 Tax=Cytobacillus spartinae TaxID=3299023 RepID=A0ABW6K8B5_9BACI